MAENNYLVIVMDRWGRLLSRTTPSGKEVEFRELFEKSQDAERYAIRRLSLDCEPLSYALVQSTRMMDREGNPLTLKITREEAMHKAYPKPKSPATRVTKSKRGVSFYQMHVGQTRVEFSRG